MKRGLLVAAVLGAMVFGTVAWAFDAYFADSQGNKITKIQEGRRFWVVVNDTELGACPPGEFYADLVIFDFKTGAYIEQTHAKFLEIPNQSHIYYWVDDGGNKVSVEAGSRSNPTTISGQTHVLGNVYPSGVASWKEGAWEYVDQDVLGDTTFADATTPVNTGVTSLPQHRAVARVDFEGMTAGTNVTPGEIKGRLENNDTLILIVAAEDDERLIDQDQIKIVDTTSTITVEPGTLEYGCGTMCNVRVEINDPDENLDPNQIDYVPFFVIVNPGSWNPQTSSINTFCALKMYGSVTQTGSTIMDLAEPIRWYNIYDEPVTADGGENSRWIEYPSSWLDGTYTINGVPVGKALFFAQETGPDTGVFEYNFGTLEDLQKALGFSRFDPGTTIAFYYLDPNDFDDFSLTTAQVYERPRSEVYFTDYLGNPVDKVKIGSGLYVRVYDADANIEACCQDKVVVHLCDPHNDDDSEYWILDEVANNAGIFASKAAMPLEPVWDAVGGYQLVFDDWKFQAFNEDTIYVRYNSVDYRQEDLNALGDGNANDGYFPPRINQAASRNQVWDVSFDTVKVFDTQVFDGTTHHMRFLNGKYEPVDEIPLSGNLYLEVTDPDQNENPLMAELIRGKWNLDAYTGDDGDRTTYYSNNAPAVPSKPASPQDANEDSAPIWWKYGGDSDRMTPQGGVTSPSPLYLGATAGGTPSTDDSITGLLETAKIFMWNAQRGTWEVMDLKETAPDSGVFRSTTCVLVADSRHPGDGNLGSHPEDTIFAFYQDPSNHSDVSIISIKVGPGGAAGVTPPTRALKVEFDKDTYTAGETVTITVTDDAFAGAAKISGTDILVLKIDDTVLQSWNEIPAKSGTTNQFEVTYTLPEDVSGTLTVTYTQPFPGGRTVSATATVLPAALQEVTDVAVSPNPFNPATEAVSFNLVTVPEGAKAEKMTLMIFDLLGRKIFEDTESNVNSISWDGGNYRSGAYIAVVMVEDSHLSAPFVWRGFVYIKR